MDEINGKCRLERKWEILKENKKNTLNQNTVPNKDWKINSKPEERMKSKRKYQRNE